MSMSELDNAIRTGSALSDLMESASRDGVVIGMTIYPDQSYSIRLTVDGSDWEWSTSGLGFVATVKKATKAITARRLHIENGAKR